MVRPDRPSRDDLAGVMSDGGKVENVNFIGRLAKTWNKEMEKAAAEMLKKGASRDEILRDTGVFGQRGAYAQAPSIQLKREIPGSQAKIKPAYQQEMQENFDKRYWGSYDTKLGEALDYPDLYAAYPDLETLPITTNIKQQGQATGSYNKNWEPKTLGGLPQGMGGPSVINGNISSMQQLRDLLVHEIQHAIQWREGFPSGANPRMTGMADIAKKMGLKAQAEIDKIKAGAAGVNMSPEEYMRIAGISPKDYSGYKNVASPSPSWQQQGPEYLGYRLHAGEVEANNAMWRAGFLSPEDLLKQQPWLTQEFPDILQERIR